jgi:hypothetical protein
MKVPNYFTTKFVDDQGYLTPEYQVFFQDLITQMQINLSDEGFRIPQQTTATIAQLKSSFNSQPKPNVYFGDLLYDSTTDEAKINIAGTFKVIQVV